MVVREIKAIMVKKEPYVKIAGILIDNKNSGFSRAETSYVSSNKTEAHKTRM